MCEKSELAQSSKFKETIIQLFYREASSAPRFEHVPSGANLADLPSRDDFELLHEMGSTSFSSELVWPDLTASMPDVFSDLWRRYSPGRPTNSRKRHAREVEVAIEAAREAPRKAPRRG